MWWCGRLLKCSAPSLMRSLDLVGGGPLDRDIRSLVSNMKLTGVNFKGVAGAP